ncbi:unnamed protein product [Diatraea saccharalis]|uniref:Uncharacterized protein n=1 Tax=Diatraea saccharalis TaxID=40085 RepID=A0A9N9RCU3_9NEOP|nr:unnamed protein product [Diatraea saccharalis]
MIFTGTVAEACPPPGSSGWPPSRHTAFELFGHRRCHVCSHAAASDRYPHNALDRSVVDGIQAISEIDARAARSAETFRGRTALSTAPLSILFISSEKRKGARKTFTYAIYGHGDKDIQRNELAWAWTPGLSLVPPVRGACVGTLLRRSDLEG